MSDSMFVENFARVAKDLDDARGKTVTVERERDALKLEKVELEKKVAAATGEAEQLRTQLGGALEKLAGANAFINAAATLKTDIEVAQVQAAQTQERLVSLEGQLAASKAERAAAEDRGNALAEELKEGAAAVERAERLEAAFRQRAAGIASIKAVLGA